MYIVQPNKPRIYFSHTTIGGGIDLLDHGKWKVSSSLATIREHASIDEVVCNQVWQISESNLWTINTSPPHFLIIDTKCSVDGEHPSATKILPTRVNIFPEPFLSCYKHAYKNSINIYKIPESTEPIHRTRNPSSITAYRLYLNLLSEMKLHRTIESGLEYPFRRHNRDVVQNTFHSK